MRLFIGLCLLWTMGWLTAACDQDHKIVCYYGSWAGSRDGIGAFNLENIDATLCTHLIYAFVGIGEDGTVTVLDPSTDLPDDGGKNGFARFLALRTTSPESKFMLSIGGWDEGSTKFSTIVNNATLRATFVDNAWNFLHEFGFDGLDLDWEYPNQRGGLETDVENFVELLKALRDRFDEEGLILSAAVAAAEISASLSYDVSGLSEYLHFINVMTYDFHGAWDTVAGHNTPLYPAERENESDRKINIDAAVKYWLDQGAPAEKLIVGTAFYGKSFTLSDPAENKPGSPITADGSGVLRYNQICERVSNGSWTVMFDEEQRVPYAYFGDKWLTYDDVESISEKANYIIEMGLGGAMLWSIDEDDFAGICGDKYPLLNTLNDVLC